MDSVRAILDEIYKAALRLGADAEEIRAVPAGEMYEALEALGADRFLLGIVGSWRDCIEDAEALSLLTEYNLRGGFKFDEMIASTSGPTSPGRRIPRRAPKSRKV